MVSTRGKLTIDGKRCEEDGWILDSQKEELSERPRCLPDILVLAGESIFVLGHLAVSLGDGNDQQRRWGRWFRTRLGSSLGLGASVASSRRAASHHLTRDLHEASVPKVQHEADLGFFRFLRNISGKVLNLKVH